MHHPAEDYLAENGMVAPSRSSSLVHQETGYSILPESLSRSKAGKTQSIPDEAVYPVEVNDGEEKNGSCKNGHVQESLKEAKTEMEGFIMRENDIDVIQEPVAERDSFKNGATDDLEDLHPSASSDRDADAVADESLAPQRRKVQWNDDNGKELFRVYEYEASDTGDSEDDDDDDADGHACVCTIQ